MTQEDRVLKIKEELIKESNILLRLQRCFSRCYSTEEEYCYFSWRLLQRVYFRSCVTFEDKLEVLLGVVK